MLMYRQMYMAVFCWFFESPVCTATFDPRGGRSYSRRPVQGPIESNVRNVCNLRNLLQAWTDTTDVEYLYLYIYI